MFTIYLSEYFEVDLEITIAQRKYGAVTKANINETWRNVGYVYKIKKVYNNRINYGYVQ